MATSIGSEEEGEGSGEQGCCGKSWWSRIGDSDGYEEEKEAKWTAFSDQQQVEEGRLS
jgi:hypothetical protein